MGVVCLVWVWLTSCGCGLSCVGVAHFLWVWSVLQIEPPTVVGEGGTLLTLASEAEGDDSFTHIVEISSVSATLSPFS